MTNKEFNDFLLWQQGVSFEVLNRKANEYAANNYRFHNFNIAKDILKLIGKIDTKPKTAFAFMTKHFVSLIDLLNEQPEELAEEIIAEKCGDLINYTHFIHAMLLEEKHKGECNCKGNNQ
ncbi:MAG: hypothetical protein KF896_14260 [Ignavibacteriae bacterium]|nr:hypothetical protein [Ignavibacteriota bacterium]